MAIYSATDTTYIEEIRRRLKENINADLSDIFRKVNEDRTKAERRYLNRMLNKWFIDLFSGDYKEAKKALTKCIALNPHKEVTPAEMTMMMQLIWKSCEILFNGDFNSLMEEIDRNLEKSGIKPAK